MPTRAERPREQADFVSPQLAAACRHPTRVARDEHAGRGPASPRQLAEAIDEPLNNVTYHVKQLRDLGCIELDRTERRAGGRVLERFYRATQRAYFDDDAWEVLSEKERLGVIWSIDAADLQGHRHGDDPRHLLRRRRRHTSRRSPMTVDQEGWDEITALLERATQGAVRDRKAGGGAPRRGRRRARRSTPRSQMLQFRSPPPPRAPPLAADRLADDVLDPRLIARVQVAGFRGTFSAGPRTRSARLGEVVPHPVAAFLGEPEGDRPDGFPGDFLPDPGDGAFGDPGRHGTEGTQAVLWRPAQTVQRRPRARLPAMPDADRHRR